MSAQRDSDLILRFYDMRREPRLREARSFMLGQFKAKTMGELNEQCPPGSEENAFFRQVVGYWDMIGAIALREIEDMELFFETNGEITAVWEKIRELVPGLREAFQSPAFLRNVEKLANEREKYLERVAPGYLEGLRKRLS